MAIRLSDWVPHCCIHLFYAYGSVLNPSLYGRALHSRLAVCKRGRAARLFRRQKSKTTRHAVIISVVYHVYSECFVSKPIEPLRCALVVGLSTRAWPWFCVAQASIRADYRRVGRRLPPQDGPLRADREDGFKAHANAQGREALQASGRSMPQPGGRIQPQVQPTKRQAARTWDATC